MKFKTFFYCALVTLAFPAFAFAGPIVRSGNSVSISTDQILENDFYGFASDITLSGESKSDVSLAGNSLTVNAPVAGDLNVLGADINIHAPIGDDLRIVGGSVVVASKVAGDIVMLGGSLKILSTADVRGDVLFLGGQLTVEGQIAGSVYGRSETARIDAVVGGDVRVRAMQYLTLGDRAHITGGVVYTSIRDIERSQNAVVEGSVIKEPSLDVPDSEPISIMLPVLIILFTSLALYMLFRERIQILTNAAGAQYGFFGLVGLGLLIGVPILGAILMVSVVGVIVSISLFLMYILAIIVAWSLAGVVCGTLIMRRIMKTNQVTFLSALAGTLLFMLLWFVPIIGPIVSFAAFLIVFGGLGVQFYRFLR